MKTADFLKLINQHPEKPLRFRDHRDSLVHPSYHVSEVKTATLETVDCGNLAHRWTETILQLWLSDDPDAEKAMLTGKVTQIFTSVARKISIDPEAEVRIEYGSEDFPPIVFHIAEIAIGNDLMISLGVPSTQCKLEERGGSCARPEIPQVGEAESCCHGTSSTCC
jgi:hypothetical protein